MMNSAMSPFHGSVTLPSLRRPPPICTVVKLKVPACVSLFAREAVFALVLAQIVLDVADPSPFHLICWIHVVPAAGMRLELIVELFLMLLLRPPLISNS